MLRPPTATTDKLRRAKEILDERFCEELRVKTLANDVGLSRAHFIRAFHEVFGQPPHQYLVGLRMARAAQLLRSTDLRVCEICRATGWQSVGSFTTRFTRTHGMSPTAYRSPNVAGEPCAGAEHPGRVALHA